MGAVDVINALNQPTLKLIDTVSGAIGKIYEPRYKKKMADAEAYEIEKIGKAIRDNCDMPITYNPDGTLQIDTSNYEELIKRTGLRLAFQEVKKQENIEAVVDNAYQLLEQETVVSNEPVDNGWMIRFMNSVEDIEDNELQEIWSKILAEEIIKPRTYSLRTLEVLRNISKEEAKLFQKIASFITGGFIINDIKFISGYDVTYSDILVLDDCGLINSDGMVQHNIPLHNQQIIIFNKTYVLIYSKPDNVVNSPTLKLDAFVLTEAGKNILKILDISTNDNYFLDLCRYIKSKYPNLKLSVHKIKEINDDVVSFYKEEINAIL